VCEGGGRDSARAPRKSGARSGAVGARRRSSFFMPPHSPPYLSRILPCHTISTYIRCLATLSWIDILEKPLAARPHSFAGLFAPESSSFQTPPFPSLSGTATQDAPRNNQETRTIRAAPREPQATRRFAAPLRTSGCRRRRRDSYRCRHRSQSLGTAVAARQGAVHAAGRRARQLRRSARRPPVPPRALCRALGVFVWKGA